MKWLNGYRIRLVLIGIVVAILFGGGRAKADFTFGETTNLGPTVNSSYYDSDPSISADGLRLFFSSNRPGGYGNWDIWVVTRADTDCDWSTPVNLGRSVNNPAEDMDPSISADGLSLFFRSNRAGGLGEADLYVTTRSTIGDPWSEPVNLGSIVNSEGNDADPSISHDGLSLYFSTFSVFLQSSFQDPRPGGLGGDDVWVTIRSSISDTWSEPINLGASINSAYHDFMPWISSDGLILFFNSLRPRPSGFGDPPIPFGDTYVAFRPTPVSPWEELHNLGLIMEDFAGTDLEVSADGSTIYFNLDNQVGGVDLCQLRILPIVNFNGDVTVDSADMCIMIDHWGTDNSLCDIGPMPWGDGIVDVEDLKVLAKHLFDDCNALAHWKLDEKLGNIAHDYVGGYDAILHGNPIWHPGGCRSVGALQFDGSDDYIVTPFILNPSLGAFSVVVWVKGGDHGQVVISQSDGDVTGIGNTWLGLDAKSGTLMTGLVSPSAGWVAIKPLVSEFSISDGQWHHVGFVWDGSYRILYADGIEVAKDTAAQNPLKPADGGLHIGAGKTLNAGTFFSGLIDDLRIYNRAVSP